MPRNLAAALMLSSSGRGAGQGSDREESEGRPVSTFDQKGRASCRGALIFR